MYVTLAQLKTYLGIASAETSDDALLTELLTAAQAFIESPAGAGRVFAASANTMRTLDADQDAEGDCLYLGADLCQLDSITMDGASVTLGAIVPAPRNDKPWYALRLKTGAWTGEIVISGRWAYSVTPPTDIVHACRRLAATLYRQKDNAQDVGQPVMSADGVVIMPAAVPKDVQAICAAYRSLV